MSKKVRTGKCLWCDAPVKRGWCCSQECAQKRRWAIMSVRKRNAIRRKQSLGEERSWSESRREVHTARMQQGMPQQVLMTERRRAVGYVSSVLAQKAWWDDLDPAEKEQMVEDRTDRIIETYNGRPNRGFVKGKQGYIATRFGKLRYDSGWELLFIKVMSALKLCKTLTRDYVVRYNLAGKLRRFMVDFCVEFGAGRKYLVELKCPYFADTDSTKAKVLGAKKHAKKYGFTFIMITSKQDLVKEKLCQMLV